MKWVFAGGAVLVPAIDAARNCVRCGAATHMTVERGGAHLCRDVKSRLDQAVAAARDAIWSGYAREIADIGGEA